jgi:DNA-binding response OmpR family regulator
MNGYEVLDRMKADSELRNIPVIVLSASDEMQSAVRSIQRGAEDYLAKPFDPVLLRARIRSSLQKKRWRDQEEIYRRQIEEEKRRADDLLHVILPVNCHGVEADPAGGAASLRQRCGYVLRYRELH